MKRATELEWLERFYLNCDFGPADEEGRIRLQQIFEERTGKKIPEGYEIEC